MKRIPFNTSRLIGYLLIFGSTIVKVAGQSQASKESAFIDGSGDRYWYTIGAVAVIGVVGLIILWRRNKSANARSSYEYSDRLRTRNDYSEYDDEGVDADKELEWFRNAKKSAKVEVRTGSERRRTGRRIKRGGRRRARAR